jgi:hypothetical protein
MLKKWICYNVLGENPNTIDAFGIVSGLGILLFLFSSWAFLFVFLPLYVWIM